MKLTQHHRNVPSARRDTCVMTVFGKLLAGSEASVVPPIAKGVVESPNHARTSPGQNQRPNVATSTLEFADSENAFVAEYGHRVLCMISEPPSGPIPV